MFQKQIMILSNTRLEFVLLFFYNSVVVAVVFSCVFIFKFCCVSFVALFLSFRFYFLC